MEIIDSTFRLAGADIVFTGSYPGWKPNTNSRILEKMQAVYERDFGKTPRIMTIHAGLECGIIGKNYPGLDMISFGPTIVHPHSPSEAVNIETVDKFYRYRRALIRPPKPTACLRIASLTHKHSARLTIRQAG